MGFEDVNEEEPMHMRTWWSRLTTLATRRMYDCGMALVAMLNILGHVGY